MVTSFSWILAACLAASCLASPHWPSDAEWMKLNVTVHGRLHAGTPLARPCFPRGGNVLGAFNAAQCSVVEDGYVDHFFRKDQFGAYMNTQWESCQSTDADCLLDSNNSTNSQAFQPPRLCAQGSISKYFIDVRSVEDVQAGLHFSQTTGVPLVIKNTGHDYKGRSSAPNSLALWTHNLQSISFKRDFVPLGCPEHMIAPAVTFGAGVIQGTLFQFADKMNITLPGGADATVGVAGGYLQGGGHSAFANTLGLAVDRVIEFEVVTPTGEHMKANACSNSDLFFALRGGGGGTFAVVINATMKALPPMSFPVLNVQFTPTVDKERQLLSFLVNNSLSYAQQGWGGYIVLRQSVTFVNPLMNLSEAITSMSSFQELVANKLNGTFSLVMEPSYLTFFNKYLNDTGVPVGLPFITTSRLIPADNFRSPSSREELFKTLVPVLDNAPLPIIFAATPFLFKDDGSTSVTNAWRDSVWHVTASGFWNFDTLALDRNNLYHTLSRSMDELRAITPHSGAYQNEADVLEPNPADAFWGSHYDRLVKVKRKYDPNHLLDCWHCVDWRGPLNKRYSCYL